MNAAAKMKMIKLKGLLTLMGDADDAGEEPVDLFESTFSGWL